MYIALIFYSIVAVAFAFFVYFEVNVDKEDVNYTSLLGTSVFVGCLWPLVCLMYLIETVLPKIRKKYREKRGLNARN